MYDIKKLNSGTIIYVMDEDKCTYYVPKSVNVFMSNSIIHDSWDEINSLTEKNIGRMFTSIDESDLIDSISRHIRILHVFIDETREEIESLQNDGYDIVRIRKMKLKIHRRMRFVYSLKFNGVTYYSTTYHEISSNYDDIVVQVSNKNIIVDHHAIMKKGECTAIYEKIDELQSEIKDAERDIADLENMLNEFNPAVLK